MSARRTRATFLAAALSTAVAFGLAAPASAAPVPASGAVSVQAAGHLSGKDPFPKLTPAKILAKSAAAAKSAKSVRMHGTAKVGDVGITMDGILTRTAGQVKLTKSAGGTFMVIRQGKVLYLNGDLKFWVAVADGNQEDIAFAPKIANKWVQLTGTGGASKDLVELTTLATVAKDVSSFKAAKRVAGVKASGKATVGLAGTDEGIPAVLYVAAAGAPYPMAEIANDRSLTTTYSDWNRALKVSKPKPAYDLPVNVIPAAALLG